MGRQMYSKKLGRAQFWIANIGLVAMLVFYTLMSTARRYTGRSTVLAGVLEMVSIFLFFYTCETLIPPVEQPN